MSATTKKFGANFGSYGNMEAFVDEDGSYSVSMFITNKQFDSSIHLNLRNLNRKQAKKLLKFDFEKPEKSLKMVFYEISQVFNN